MQRKMIVKTDNPGLQGVFIKGAYHRFANQQIEVDAVDAHELLGRNAGYSIIKSENPLLKNNLIPFNTDNWNSKYRKLIAHTPISFENGYGKAAIMMIRGLIQEGVDVKTLLVNWGAHSDQHVAQEVRDSRAKTGENLDTFHIMMNVGNAFGMSSAKRLVGYTMLETTLIPESFVKGINENAERVIVPCTQNRQAFIDSGVKVDVEVIHLGIDPELYQYKERKESDVYTFGTMGHLTHRKGTDILVRAFQQAFQKGENVRLILKTHSAAMKGGAIVAPYLKGTLNDKRIIFVNEVYTPEILNTEFFHKIDCFVFPTRGEGYGLPPVEAMATGLPVIGTNWSGLADYMNSDYSYPLDYDIVDMPPPPYGYGDELRRDGQQWAEPKIDHLIELMRHVYNNRGEAIAKGARANAYVRRWLTFREQAKKIIKYLDKKV